MARPGQRRSSSRQRRSRPEKLALGLTQLWFFVALLSLFFLNGYTFDTAGLHLHPNYLFLVTSALIPAAVWSWYFHAQDREKEAGKSLQELQDLTPDAFERWVAARFRDMGYSTKVSGTHGAGGDHGVDIVAEKPGEKAVIQCKNWKAWRVGEPKLRDLYGAMADFGADRACLVTTGSVTEPARQWIDGKPIEVWDGDYLVRLFKQMAPHGAAILGDELKDAATVTGEGNESKVALMMETQSAADTIFPNCPRCGSALVERRNRRTGELFLGCPRFPSCRPGQPLAS